ncbi:MAG: hypothetical protein SGCHY_003763 [Lobulomycetales sp.]
MSSEPAVETVRLAIEQETCAGAAYDRTLAAALAAVSAEDLERSPAAARDLLQLVGARLDWNVPIATQLLALIASALPDLCEELSPIVFSHKQAAGKTLIPLCISRLTLPSESRFFAELLVDLLENCPENISLLAKDPNAPGPSKDIIRIRHLVPNAGHVDTQLLLLRVLLACIPSNKKEASFFLANLGEDDGFERIDKDEFEVQARLYLYTISPNHVSHSCVKSSTTHNTKAFINAGTLPVSFQISRIRIKKEDNLHEFNWSENVQIWMDCNTETLVFTVCEESSQGVCLEVAYDDVVHLEIEESPTEGHLNMQIEVIRQDETEYIIRAAIVPRDEMHDTREVVENIIAAQRSGGHDSDALSGSQKARVSVPIYSLTTEPIVPLAEGEEEERETASEGSQNDARVSVPTAKLTTEPVASAKSKEAEPETASEGSQNDARVSVPTAKLTTEPAAPAKSKEGERETASSEGNDLPQTAPPLGKKLFEIGESGESSPLVEMQGLDLEDKGNEEAVNRIPDTLEETFDGEFAEKSAGDTFKEKTAAAKSGARGKSAGRDASKKSKKATRQGKLTFAKSAAKEVEEDPFSISLEKEEEEQIKTAAASRGGKPKAVAAAKKPPRAAGKGKKRKEAEDEADVEDDGKKQKRSKKVGAAKEDSSESEAGSVYEEPIPRRIRRQAKQQPKKKESKSTKASKASLAVAAKKEKPKTDVVIAGIDEALPDDLSDLGSGSQDLVPADETCGGLLTKKTETPRKKTAARRVDVDTIFGPGAKEDETVVERKRKPSAMEMAEPEVFFEPAFDAQSVAEEEMEEVVEQYATAKKTVTKSRDTNKKDDSISLRESTTITAASRSVKRRQGTISTAGQAEGEEPTWSSPRRSERLPRAEHDKAEVIDEFKAVDKTPMNFAEIEVERPMAPARATRRETALEERTSRRSRQSTRESLFNEKTLVYDEEAPEIEAGLLKGDLPGTDDEFESRLIHKIAQSMSAKKRKRNRAQDKTRYVSEEADVREGQFKLRGGTVGENAPRRLARLIEQRVETEKQGKAEDRYSRTLPPRAGTRKRQRPSEKQRDAGKSMKDALNQQLSRADTFQRDAGKSMKAALNQEHSRADTFLQRVEEIKQAMGESEKLRNAGSTRESARRAPAKAGPIEEDDEASMEAETRRVTDARVRKLGLDPGLFRPLDSRRGQKGETSGEEEATMLAHLAKDMSRIFYSVGGLMFDRIYADRHSRLRGVVHQAVRRRPCLSNSVQCEAVILETAISVGAFELEQ